MTVKQTSTENIIEFDSWEDFESKHLTYFPDTGGIGGYSTLLYRGQQNSSWDLCSSLSRYLQKDEVSVEAYDDIADAIKNKTNTMLDLNFKKYDRQQDIDYKNYDFHNLMMKISSHDIAYKVYLRHYGFPSPLLDWTRSLYIASYFAFAEKNNESDKVAIFCLREYNGHGKTWGTSENLLCTIGPYMETDKRHFLQQAEYTLCFGQDNQKNTVYTGYDWLIQNKNMQASQGIIYKFLIPSSEREKVMKKLISYNITGYSLFQTTEALFSSIAFDELVINKRL